MQTPHQPTRGQVLSGLAALATGAALPTAAAAASARKLAASAEAALTTLYSHEPKARAFGPRARAILVFPQIVKAGLMVGGQTGDGALLRKGRAVAFYNISAASFGFQAGAQKFSYALFFANEKALDYLKQSGGWAVGTGPSLVLVDEGYAKSMTSTTLTQDVYAFAFGQKGLMGGAGLEGSKITQIYPDP